VARARDISRYEVVLAIIYSALRVLLSSSKLAKGRLPQMSVSLSIILLIPSTIVTFLMSLAAIFFSPEVRALRMAWTVRLEEAS
jgi:hypothetical protein